MKKYFQAPWSLIDLIIVLCIVMGLISLTVFLTNFYGVNEYIDASPYKIYLVILTFIVQWLIILTPLFFYSKRKYKISKNNFGFKKIGWFKNLKLVVWGFLVFLGISFIISAIILFLEVKIPGYQIQESLLPLFGDRLPDLIIAGIVMILIAPLLEEIFFRGFVFRSLANKVGTVSGSIISAGFFAAFHAQWQSIIPIFILGLIINAIVIKGKSIWPAFYFHAFNNAIAFTVEILIFKEIIPIEEIV